MVVLLVLVATMVDVDAGALLHGVFLRLLFLHVFSADDSSSAFIDEREASSPGSRSFSSWRTVVDTVTAI